MTNHETRLNELMRDIRSRGTSFDALSGMRKVAELVVDMVAKDPRVSESLRRSFSKGDLNKWLGIIGDNAPELGIPKEIYAALRSLQVYGNCGAHYDRDNERPNKLSVDAAMASAELIFQWVPQGCSSAKRFPWSRENRGLNKVTAHGRTEVFNVSASPGAVLSTLPSPDLLVQSLVDALTPVLTPLLGSLPLVDLMQGADKTLRDAVVEAARKVTEQALSQPQRPEQAAYKKTFRVHSVLGLLTFVRWGTRDEQGMHEPLPHALWGHGCTAAVRQQITWLHALATTEETLASLGMFGSAQPSLTTVHRVAVSEGCALAKQFSPELFGTLLTARVQPVAEQVHLVVIGADGGHVPMRGEALSAAREWHEGRVVTATLLGAANPEKPRTITLLDGKRREHQVGGERPVLATVVLGQMPTLDGPKAERVEASLKKLHTVVKTLCPQAAWQGLCDGGDWPEDIVDAVVGSERRTTDCGHASSHLMDAAKARFEDETQARAWWAEERTRLLTEPGEAGRLVKELARSAAHLPRPDDKKSLETEVGYFRKRAENMAYAERLAANEAIGSGPTEAAVKQVITVRLKRVGATWGAEGGDAVMHTRSLVVSQMFEGAWQERVRQQFAPYQAAA